MADYYQLLGVSKGVSDDELKKAYRKMARKYHPDVSKEANAEEKFKEVQTAYDVLKDKEKRKLYDQFGDQWQQAKQAKDQGFDPGAAGFGGGGAGFGGFGFGDDVHVYTSGGGGPQDDIFESIFGGGGFKGGAGFGGGRAQSRRPQPTKGKDIRATVDVDLIDAYNGTEKTFQVGIPQADGSTNPKALKVKIPKGITNGQQIRLSGQGGAGSHGGANGDIYIKVHIKPHQYFNVEGADIYLDLPITPWEAALGTKINVPTLGGTIGLTIPAGSESGQKMRLKGRGLPAKNSGDQYCVLKIVTPPADDDQAKQFYNEMAEKFKFNPRKRWES